MKKPLLNIRTAMWGFCILVGISAFFVYPHLPAEIPTHWNSQGQIDDYSPRAMVFLFSFLPLILMVLFEVFPKIDPKKRNYALHQKAYRTVVFSVVLFMAAIYVITILASLGFSVSVDFLVKLGMAFLFLLLGNVLGQVRHNYFFGIRTPWTLASETVWRRTHRVGGYAYMVAGLFALISAFLSGPASFWLMIVPVILISFGLMIYSLYLFKKLEKNEPPTD